jgi:sugar phosphate isomerase/epimerase
MKYSFMTFSTPDLTLDEVLQAASKYGYDGVEPRAESGHRHGVETSASSAAREEIRATASEAGVAFSCVATSCVYADPETQLENVEKTHAFIDLAADIGCTRIRVFGGRIGGGLSREEAIELVTGSLTSVAGHAGERGVVVCMETHDDWCDPAHVARIMTGVGHGAIGVNWDIMHPVRAAGYTMEDACVPIQKWVSHVHFHDGVREGKNTSLVPIGRGFVDHRTAVRILLEAGYTGFLSGEWIDWERGYETHLPGELSTMKSYEPGA